MRRARGTRTPNRWFWRPVLYQLSYCPSPQVLGACGGTACVSMASEAVRASIIRDGCAPRRTDERRAVPGACAGSRSARIGRLPTGPPAYGRGRPGGEGQWQDRHVTNPRSPLASLSDDDLAGFLAEQRSAYASLQSRGLKLDLTRGK